jgi:hypothetical protein
MGIGIGVGDCVGDVIDEDVWSSDGEVGLRVWKVFVGGSKKKFVTSMQTLIYPKVRDMNHQTL